MQHTPPSAIFGDRNNIPFTPPPSPTSKSRGAKILLKEKEAVLQHVMQYSEHHSE